MENEELGLLGIDRTKLREIDVQKTGESRHNLPWVDSGAGLGYGVAVMTGTAGDEVAATNEVDLADVFFRVANVLVNTGGTVGAEFSANLTSLARCAAYSADGDAHLLPAKPGPAISLQLDELRDVERSVKEMRCT
jgi:hypothetical protein